MDNFFGCISVLEQCFMGLLPAVAFVLSVRTVQVLALDHDSCLHWRFSNDSTYDENAVGFRL